MPFAVAVTAGGVVMGAAVSSRLASNVDDSVQRVDSLPEYQLKTRIQIFLFPTTSAYPLPAYWKWMSPSPFSSKSFVSEGFEI